MRQTIGTTWILQLMILFILLFVGFIILTLNYSKVIKLKNETVSIIEKYEGLNNTSIGFINNYLTTSGYATKGKCQTGTYGVYGALSLESNSLENLETANPDSTYFYCIKKYEGQNISNYYQITLFYKFNLPVIGNASSYTVKGTSTNIIANDNRDYCATVTGSGC